MGIFGVHRMFSIELFYINFVSLFVQFSVYSTLYTAVYTAFHTVVFSNFIVLFPL